VATPPPGKSRRCPRSRRAVHDSSRTRVAPAANHRPQPGDPCPEAGCDGSGCPYSRSADIAAASERKSRALSS
jgi:hypothetical protein